MNTATLVGYFVTRDEARQAFRKLQQKGYRRVAWVDLDAQRVKNGVIPLSRDLVKHRVVVRMEKLAHRDSDASLDEGGVA